MFKYVFQFYSSSISLSFFSNSFILWSFILFYVQSLAIYASLSSIPLPLAEAFRVYIFPFFSLTNLDDDLTELTEPVFDRLLVALGARISTRVSFFNYPFSKSFLNRKKLFFIWEAKKTALSLWFFISMSELP